MNKNRFLKIFLMLSFVLVSFSVLSGCSSDEDEDDSSETDVSDITGDDVDVIDQTDAAPEDTEDETDGAEDVGDEDAADADVVQDVALDLDMFDFSRTLLTDGGTWEVTWSIGSPDTPWVVERQYNFGLTVVDVESGESTTMVAPSVTQEHLVSGEQVEIFLNPGLGNFLALNVSLPRTGVWEMPVVLSTAETSETATFYILVEDG